MNLISRRERSILIVCVTSDRFRSVFPFNPARFLHFHSQYCQSNRSSDRHVISKPCVSRKFQTSETAVMLGFAKTNYHKFELKRAFLSNSRTIVFEPENYHSNIVGWDHYNNFNIICIRCCSERRICSRKIGKIARADFLDRFALRFS